MPNSYDPEIAAKFYLVFGEGMTILDAEEKLRAAKALEMLEWVQKARAMWAGFEALIDNVIAGDGSLLDRHPTYKTTLADRVRKAARKFPFRVHFERVT